MISSINLVSVISPVTTLELISQLENDQPKFTSRMRKIDRG
jgi:hypothetical protein